MTDESEKTGGIRCPECGSRELRVHMTRQESDRVRRVRICRRCGKQIMTAETLVDAYKPPTVH